MHRSPKASRTLNASETTTKHTPAQAPTKKLLKKSDKDNILRKIKKIKGTNFNIKMIGTKQNKLENQMVQGKVKKQFRKYPEALAGLMNNED